MEKDSPPNGSPAPLEYATPVKPPSESKLENLLSQFNSPTSRLMVFQAVGIVCAIGVAWLIISAFFSLFSIWVIILLTIVLAGVVFYRERQKQQREWWILQGQCADCGYDLRATPQRCPECGRDAFLDEPIWRKTRRQLEAKLLANAAGENLAPPPTIPRTPKPVDDTPIPLEGEESGPAGLL